MHHRQAQRAIEPLPPQTIVHPRAAALFRRARIGIQIKRRNALAIAQHIEKLHVFVPLVRGFALCAHNLDIEQPLGEGEHAVEHFGQGKIGAQLIVCIVEFLLAQPL